MTDIAGDRRTHDQLVNTPALNLIRKALINQRSRFKQDFIRARLDDVMCDYTPKNPARQWHNHVATLDERCHSEALIGPTVMIRDHQILCHVDQTTRQVT